MTPFMRLYTLRPLLIVVLALGCESVLDVAPINETAEDDAITTPAKARAAVAGMFDGLQDDDYYGGTLLFFGDLSAEDVEHTGTFTSYRQVDLNAITSDNVSIESMWDALYRTVGRANIVIARVPSVTGLDPGERDEMLGAAYLIRALTFHNVARFWGDPAPTGLGIPLPLEPAPDLVIASQITRATTAQTYTQILSDLAQAQTLLGSVGVIRAIRARVLLYQQNWAAAEAEAEAVVALGYSLAPDYSDLFTASGDPTDEDIFRVAFNEVDYNYLGYYYRAKGAAGGRREITPSDILLQAYDPGYVPGNPATYTPVDLRGEWNVAFTGGGTLYGSKYPTGIGAEDLHVIRFAEVLLIQAEAEARQNKLTEAEATLAPIRVRAGLTALDLDVLMQQQAIDAILRERRLELAYEGDRWPDLVRTGLAVTTLGIPAFQTLYPIPLNEIDIAPGLVQNTGY